MKTFQKERALSITMIKYYSRPYLIGNDIYSINNLSDVGGMESKIAEIKPIKERLKKDKTESCLLCRLYGEKHISSCPFENKKFVLFGNGYRDGMINKTLRNNESTYMTGYQIGKSIKEISDNCKGK